MPIAVEFVSPERIIFESQATQIIVRTSDGEIGFLPGHVPFVGVLAAAEARVHDADGSTIHRFAVHRGFVEIANDHCTVLSDVAERVEDIDRERAKAALERAEAALLENDEDNLAGEAAVRAKLRLALSD